MILNILNENRELIDIIRFYDSCLWTRKYRDVGGCVLTITPTYELVNMFLNEAKYISRDDDPMLCEIKRISINMDITSGKYSMQITCLGAEAIFSQRIVWNTVNSTTSAEQYMRELVLNNMIEPTISARKIDHIVLGQFKGFQDAVTKQVSYDEILSVMIELCNTYNYGFKLTPLSTGKLALEFYKGRDLTENNTEGNDSIVFSKGYNNLLSFDYEIDYSTYKNVSLIGGEGEGSARKMTVAGSATGKNRYETFTDASNLTSENNPDDYYTELLEAGVNDLSLKTHTQTFNCSINVNQYVYREDFDVGDRVTIIGDFGLSLDATIIEVIEAQDDSPYRVSVVLEI